MSPSRDRQHTVRVHGQQQVTCNDRAHVHRQQHYTHLPAVHAHGQQHQPIKILKMQDGYELFVAQLSRIVMASLLMIVVMILINDN